MNARHRTAKIGSSNDVLQQRNIVPRFYDCISQKEHTEKVITYLLGSSKRTKILVSVKDVYLLLISF